MSFYAVILAVHRHEAPSRAFLKDRLREYSDTWGGDPDLTPDLWAFSEVLDAWRYYAPALVQNGRESVSRGEDFPHPLDYDLSTSGPPIVWALRGRHHVGMYGYWLSEPEDVQEIHEALAEVNPARFDQIFGAAKRSARAEHSPKEWKGSLLGERDFRYEAIFWARLRAFYARAASEGRYVVSIFE